MTDPKRNEDRTGIKNDDSKKSPSGQDGLSKERATQPVTIESGQNKAAETTDKGSENNAEAK